MTKNIDADKMVHDVTSALPCDVLPCSKGTELSYCPLTVEAGDPRSKQDGMPFQVYLETI